MLRDYFEISRFFNMGLTGVAPVLGALSLYNLGTFSLLELFILFIIGCLSHAYGFVLNDIVDINVDKLSKELKARPLVSGRITRRKAATFAISCLIASFLLSIVFFKEPRSYSILVLILGIAYLLATIYDIVSKEYPGMDIFVVGAVFFLILFGASTIGTPTRLTWIVALIGGLQVLFMNMINGAIKDIDHDKKGLANTIAIRLGVRIHAGVVTLPVFFKTTGYIIEIARTCLIYTPFIFFSFSWYIWQILLLFLFTMLTFFLIYRLYSITTYNRNQIRKHIGITVIFMYATTPIMLASLNMYILLAALVPPLWFICSNLVLHKTVFEPKTM